MASHGDLYKDRKLLAFEANLRRWGYELVGGRIAFLGSWSAASAVRLPSASRAPSVISALMVAVKTVSESCSNYFCQTNAIRSIDILAPHFFMCPLYTAGRGRRTWTGVGRDFLVFDFFPGPPNGCRRTEGRVERQENCGSILYLSYQVHEEGRNEESK